MGKVKFGNLILDIEQVPDGHVIVAESSYNTLKSGHDGYSVLKSKLPLGINEDQLSSLAEKGQRYDQLDVQHKELQGKFGETQKALEGFQNIPKEFSIDRWNSFIKREQAEVRQGKIKELTNKVYERVRKELDLKSEDNSIIVDPRFYPQDAVVAFDPDAKDAEQQWYDILDKGHDAQLDFVKNMANKATPPGAITTGQETVPGSGDKSRDTFGDKGAQVGGMFAK